MNLIRFKLDRLDDKALVHLILRNLLPLFHAICNLLNQWDEGKTSTPSRRPWRPTEEANGHYAKALQ